MKMIPAGYMAKTIRIRPDWLKAANVIDIYSVAGCVSTYFTDYINFWKHNGYWLFDSPGIICDLAETNKIDLTGMSFFYYEVIEQEYNDENESWIEFQPEPSFATNVQIPKHKQLEGFDVVSFSVHTSPECSPLSCNGLAEKILVNPHCLVNSFEEAKTLIETGGFRNTEPGPFRIFAVYSLPEYKYATDS